MPVVRFNGARHYFRLEGDPRLPGLVLVHPVGADHSLWDKIVPTLIQDFQILRYDIRGHGGTDTPEAALDVRTLADDLLVLAQLSEWDRFAVCGLSIGGLIAIHAASAASDRISALAVCSTAAKMQAPPGGWDQRARAALEGGMAPLADGMVERMFSPSYRQRGDAFVETVRTVFLRTDPRGFAACLGVLRDADMRSALNDIEVRTLVVTGMDDALIPASATEELLRDIPAAQQLSLQCGHFPPIEEAEAFATGLCGFLLQPDLTSPAST
jgi:3-oxoadipate enol-lactonase